MPKMGKYPPTGSFRLPYLMDLGLEEGPNAYARIPGVSLPGMVPMEQYGGMERPDLGSFQSDQGGGFNVGTALKDLAGGAGNIIKKGFDYFTDDKQGMLRQMMLMNLIGTGADIYSGYQQGKQEREERRRRERAGQTAAPLYGQLLRELGQ